MKKFTKRLAAMLLAATLAVAMVPAGVMADETGEEVVDTTVVETQVSEETTVPETVVQTEEKKETEPEFVEETEKETETKAEADEDKKMDVTVTLSWDDDNDKNGVRPESVKVKLYADDEEVKDSEVTLSKEVKEDTEEVGSISGDSDGDKSWSYTWKDLDSKKDGKDIKYSVKQVEDPECYFISSVKTEKKNNDEDNDGFIVTLTDTYRVFKFNFHIKNNTKSKDTISFVLEGLGEAPMPKDAKGQMVSLDVKGSSDVSFSTVTFTKQGEFTYKFYPDLMPGDEDKYRFDKESIEDTFIVYTKESGDKIKEGDTEEQKYKLVIRKGEAETEKTTTMKIVESFTIEQLYEPVKEYAVEEVTLAKVRNQLRYYQDTDEDITFTFKLTPNPSKSSETDIPLPGEITGSAYVQTYFSGSTQSDEIHEEEFDEIKFTKPGTYSYTVSQVDDAKEGYSYSETVYEVTYTVTEGKQLDSGKYELNAGKATITKVTKTESKTATSFSFANTYGKNSSGNGGIGGSGSGGSGGSGGSNADTGDSTPVTPIMILMITALLCAAGAGFALLRKKK